jgi:hypothetical protein
MRGIVFLDGRNVFDHCVMDAAPLALRAGGTLDGQRRNQTGRVSDMRKYAAPANGRHLDALTSGGRG